MAGKSNTSATFFAQKKLLGKAHTSNLKVDGEEVIGSNIQAASSLIFGEAVPTSPSQTLYLLQSASNGAPASVEYIHFALDVLTGTTYDADSAGGGAGSDSGESSQSSGPHSYKFRLRSDYQTESSNPNKGQGIFDNSKIVHQTLGSMQLIPPFFSQDAPNPFIVKIYEDNGSGGIGDEIPLLDNIDWNVDYYNGILFLQDYDASKIPAHAKAFAYVGKMLDEVVSDTASGGGGDSDATYLVQAATGSLGAERVLTAGTGVKTVDGGANGNFTISTDNSVVASLTGSIFSGPVSFNDGVFLSGSVSGFTATGSVSFSAGLSGSLTRLSSGASFIQHSGGITVTSASSGQLTISTPNNVYSEFVGSSNGVNTKYTLDHAPDFTKNVALFVNGLMQAPATSITGAPFQDYSITGSTVYFTTCSLPPSGSVIFANYSTNENVN
tara:strand:- start:1150 stop:2469 length:1320 start_codon:yes stop_codon:yes gene_type:complete